MTLSRSESVAVLDAAKTGIRAAFARYGSSARLTESVLADLSQDAFIRVLESFDSERGTREQLANFSGKNLAIDWLKGKTYAGGSKEYLESSHDDSEDSTDMIADLADIAPNALEILEMSERNEFAQSAIERLPDAQRAAIGIMLADVNQSNSERQNLMRAIDAMQGDMPVALVAKRRRK